MPIVLVDNDILAKCAIYSLMGEVVAALGVTTHQVGVLGSARFVLSPKRLKTAGDGQGNAYQRLTLFLQNVETVEPNQIETALAAELERVAIERNVQLDVGESQLCAIAVIRATKWLCTGDKRAIFAVEQLRTGIAKLKALDGKFICLEALVRALNHTHGHAFVRNRVCASRGTDKTLEICFQCHNTVAEIDEIDEGISSYLRALAVRAPHVPGSL